jgi:hypothetical protein
LHKEVADLEREGRELQEELDRHDEATGLVGGDMDRPAAADDLATIRAWRSYAGIAEDDCDTAARDRGRC